MQKPIRQKPIQIDGRTILPGQRATVDLELTKLYTHSTIGMPVHVIHGRKPGPRLFICAAIHGDEINGVEIVRRLLKLHMLKRLRGTLTAVPVVNVHGFIHQTRYLPDRRDLNRSFPGSSGGSLTARMAKLFVDHIVRDATHGIDLHTGALHRINLPQIRANLADPETEALANAFGVPVVINAALRDGSLRAHAAERGIPMLLYEAGEALRFNELAIRAGLRGIIHVMRSLEMLPPDYGMKKLRKPLKPFRANTSTWVRASHSGVLRITVPLGAHVESGQALGMINDPFGETEVPVTARETGIVIGRTNLPLVNEGDALVHIARFAKAGAVAERMGLFAERVEAFNDLYQEEII